MVLARRPEDDRQTALEQILFLIGLAFYTVGQSMIALGRDFVDSLRPIDFAHWALLIGAVLLIPYGLSCNRSGLKRIPSYTLLLGVAGIVGMCVIDFIIWSYPLGSERSAFIQHISGEHTVWIPFIHIGPWLFGIGLALMSFSFLSASKFGVLTILIGSLLSATTTSWFTVFAYAIITLGYALCFRAQVGAYSPAK